jgi:hypothetical protein
MTAREQYRQTLAQLDAALLSGTLAVDGQVYSLRTEQGWREYEMLCDSLKGIATQVLIEEARAQSGGSTQ